MNKNKRPFFRGLLAFILKAAAVIIALILIYLALLTFPQPFFRYRLQVKNLSLYSDHPIPSKPATAILTEVQRRLPRSTIYDPKVPYRIFVCNDRARFTFFANLNYRAGGVNYFLNHHTFLRPSLIARDRLIGPSGHEVPGARTLTYYITHEVTHGVTAAHLGALTYFRLPVWIREGYADYVALYQNQGVFGNSSLSGRQSAFDFQANLIKFRNGDREMDPQQSGLYLRYHLLVAYWLDIKHRSVATLFNEKPSQAKIEAELWTFK